MPTYRTDNLEYPAIPAPRPHHRLVVPDPPEPWTLDEVDFLLWPNSPEHLPGIYQDEEAPGWTVRQRRSIQ